MGKLYTFGSPIANTYSVSKNAPLDDRLTVRYIADLTDGEEGGIAALVYKGMVVYVQEDNSLYVYIGASNATWKNKKTGAPMNGGLASNWVKIDSFVDPESFLEYYQEKLGAKILDSTDEFSTIENPFDGQFVYVRDGSEASEDESGLYIYDGGLWVRILTGSGDVTGDYVKREELEDYLKKEVLDDLAKKSDLDGYIKREDLADFLTASDLDDYLKVSELPTNVSDFINDAGYITANDLPDFLLASDLDDYVKVEDLENYIPKEELDKLATKSDLEGYIKTADAIEFLTASDLVGYVKVEDLKGYLKPEDIVDLAKKSDLDGFVKREDIADFLTASDLDIYAKKSDLDDYLKVEELPTNVSEFVNDAGYLKAEDLPDFLLASDLDDYVKVEDLEDYIPKSELEKLATKSDLDGYVKTADAIYFLTGEDLADYATKDYADSAVSTGIKRVISSNGSVPTSGTGFSISNSSSYVEEVYVDDYLHAGVYYTSKGINSSKDNGGSELEGIDYITLSNGGDSWIRFDNRSTITLYIHDDSLGFNMENIVGIINSNGTESRNPYVGYPYTESPISLSLGGNTYIKFNKDIYFTGMIEVRGEDSTEYIFGQTGSHYEDLDIYSVNVLPSVNAYADGISTRVLTEGDKDELIDKIDNSSPESISTEEILGLF